MLLKGSSEPKSLRPVILPHSQCSDSSRSRPQALHIPTEACENIIDMLYSDYAADTLKDIITLHSCALVCRAWRVRSQRMLFYKVQLSDSSSFHKLATILDAGQHLSGYVQQVELIGYHLHTTTSIFALFPAVFAWKLPNLQQITVAHLHLESPETWYPRTSDPPNFKTLPYIPLNPHFSAFLSSFTATSLLYLVGTTFRSFTEFSRMLHGLPNLEDLACSSVCWITPGGSHPGADFTQQPDWAAGRCVLPPFAPKLRRLHLLNVSKYGVERLIRTRGPHLTCFQLTILPSTPGIEDKDNDGAVNLSSCIGLRELYLSLTSQFSMDKYAALVKDLLASWKPQHSKSTLYLRPYDLRQFTRHGFADGLRGLGTIIEASVPKPLQQPSPASDPENQYTVQYQLCVSIYDWEAKREWWSVHLDSCFPTWARLRRLSMDFITLTPQDAPMEPASRPV
ncbi:hypothetical protein V8D89_001281 [Ganoderma adspersum]